ncbi:MAG: hypothetical protein JXR37_15200 [Kiritimatiellae bacterium]|nr:hypothetical protein [Kiritimatiellia bacterium]
MPGLAGGYRRAAARRVHRLVLWVLLGLGLPGLCRAAGAEPGADPAARCCPLLFVDGMLYVETHIPPVRKKILFLFDTGTTRFAVRPMLAEQLGLAADATQRLSLRLGEIEIPDAEVVVWEHPFWRPPAGLVKTRLYGGILGLNPAFKPYYTVIDYPGRKLTVYPPLEPGARMKVRGRPAAVSPFTWAGEQIFVEVDINDRRVGYFHVDTGIPGATKISSQAARDAGVTNGACELFYVGKANIGAQRLKMLDSDLSTGPFSYAKLPGIIGAIGAETMRPFEIHLDFVGSRIAFVIP